MPVFWGNVPTERPVRRELLVRLQQSLSPQAWRRPQCPLVRAGATGRGQSLLVVAWTAQMLAVERAAGVRFLRKAGIQPGYRVANTLPGALVTPGSLLLGDVVEALGGLDVPLGAITGMESALASWELLRLVEPHALVLEVTTAPTFFAAAPTQREWFFNVLVWLHREVPDAWPVLPEHVRAKDTMHWLTVPEVQCFFAYSCGDGHFHLDELLSPRVIDPGTLSPAPRGFLEVTWYDAEQGMLSYLVPWMVAIEHGECPQGKQAAIRLLDAACGDVD